MRPRPPLRLLRDPGHLLALGMGSGLAPRAPGTAGTLVGVALFALLQAGGAGAQGHAVALAATTVLGTWLAGRTARALQAHDHPAIVIDEVAGFLLTMTLVPASTAALVAGFVLFRLFDIVKPWPIGVADRRVHGGAGIMLDDLLAGAAACACLHFLVWLGLVSGS